ncbi:unnamed protein product, partial [Porites lobata]
CPARGQTCLYWKKPNHFAEVCRSKARRQRFHSLERAGSQASQTSAESILSAAFQSLVFQSITTAGVSRRESNRYRDEVFVSINLNLPQETQKNTILKAKLDTAIIGLPTSTDLKLLTLNLSIEENDPTPRNSTVSKEQPIKDKQDLICQYPECFNGVGKFQG